MTAQQLALGVVESETGTHRLTVIFGPGDDVAEVIGRAGWMIRDGRLVPPEDRS